MENNQLFEIKGSNDTYIGFGIFALGFLGLGLVFDSGSLHAICNIMAGIIAGGAVVDFLFFKKKLIRLYTDRLEIYRGVRQRKNTIPLNDILSPTLNLEKTSRTEINFRQYNNEELPVKLVKSLKIHTKKGDKVEFHRYEFNHFIFAEFLQAFRKVLFAADTRRTGTVLPTYQIDEAHQKYADFLYKDMLLQEKVEAGLLRVLYSVYNPQKGEPVQVPEGDIIYGYHNPNGTHEYFLYSQPRQGVSAEELNTANNLIEACSDNLAIIRERRQFYEAALKRLERMNLQNIRRESLRTVTDDLGKLQQSNADQIQLGREINHELRILAELHDLEHKFNQQQTDEQDRSEELKAYASLLKKYLRE